MARKGWSAASRSSVLATKNIGFCTFRSPRIVGPSSELRRRIINEALYLASIKAGVFQQSARGWGLGASGKYDENRTPLEGSVRSHGTAFVPWAIIVCPSKNPRQGELLPWLPLKPRRSSNSRILPCGTVLTLKPT